MPRIYKDGVLYNTAPSTASQLPYDNNTSTKDKIDSKMDKANPTGTGSLSLNRKANTTIGDYSVAEGDNCQAIGNSSHAEGFSTRASSDYSHAEGSLTTASGTSSHAEGSLTNTSGGNSHAEGSSTNAVGDNSHAEGYHTTASGKNSHAEGEYTIAQRKSQHVFGQYNIADTGGTGYTTEGTYIEIVGNGTSTESRSNARTLDWDGNETLAGSLSINGNQPVAPKSDLASISITGTTNNTGSTIKAGTFFYLNDTLVRAKTDISNGATLTSGTNYEVVTAGGLNKIIEIMSTAPTNISSQFTFNTSSYSDITGRVSAFYYPQLKRVFGSLACYTVTSIINTTTPFCTIASGYTPTSNLSVPSMIKLSSGEYSPYYCSMYTTGNINQQLTSSCKGIYMNFDYPLSI